MPAVAQPEHETLTREEVSDVLDREARALLRMSGAEFRRRLADGNPPDHPAVAHLALIAGAGAC
jgi:hypothetical protein